MNFSGFSKTLNATFLGVLIRTAKVIAFGAPSGSLSASAIIPKCLNSGMIDLSSAVEKPPGGAELA